MRYRCLQDHYQIQCLWGEPIREPAGKFWSGARRLAVALLQDLWLGGALGSARWLWRGPRCGGHPRLGQCVNWWYLSIGLAPL